MGRYNEGIIKTNSNCIGCNYCVKMCPVTGANVSVKTKNGGIIKGILDKNCIHCGNCITMCPHDAREHRDDLKTVLSEIESGKDISAIIDPIIYTAYPDLAPSIIGYLKSLGFKEVYDGSVGNEISIYCNTKYIKDHSTKEKSCKEYIGHLCPATTNYLANHIPESLVDVIPVQLPIFCAAIYYRKYLNVTDRFALISPCTAVYDEINNYSTGQNINYLIGLSSIIENVGIDTLKKYNEEAVTGLLGYGRIISIVGAFSQAVSSCFMISDVFEYADELDKVHMDMIHETCIDETMPHPVFLEIYSCGNGCISGPCIGKNYLNIKESFKEAFRKRNEFRKNYAREINCSEQYDLLLNAYDSLNEKDFYWESKENYHQKIQIPDSVVDEIYECMYKDTLVKKNINCKACGYSSCYEFVCAVAYGYSRIEDCVHYMNDEMQAKFYKDIQTGLPNAKAFPGNIEAYIKSNPKKEYLVAVGDLNNLSAVNELYGTNNGDKLIGHLAVVIKDFADTRGVCARFNGGEFGICFENTEKNIEDFKEAMKINISHLGIDFPITTKWGLSVIGKGKDEDAIRRALSFAAIAYHGVGDKSRNTFTSYTDEMYQNVDLEARITQRMRAAMDNNEYCIYLQPKYDHTNGEMSGAEVLARWIDKDGNIIPPGIFIPIFEKNGYILNLDRFVWTSSFQLMSKWLKEGLNPPPISVNISRMCLSKSTIVSIIGELKEAYPECVPYIQFEITESAYTGKHQELFERVQKIRDMGFLIAMDDFGSGYSSLNTLKDAPIDILKLDMGFLRGDTNVEKGYVVINSIIDMATTLELGIIAEGVETREQADIICGMGCKYIQGYYYAKPMPVVEYEKRLRG